MSHFKKLNRIIGLIIFSGLAVLLPFINWPAAPVAQAGAINNVAISVADSTPSATTTYTISFTPSTTIPSNGGYIYILIAGTTDSTGSNTSPNFSNYSVNTASSSPNSLTHLSFINYSFASGVTLGTSSQITGATPVTLVLNNVVNPSRAGHYSAHVWTTQYGTELDGNSSFGGDYYSPYFEIGNTSNVVGTITDANGNPVAGAHATFRSGGWSTNYTGYTDKNGHYGMPVPAGTYTFTLAYPYSANGKTYLAPSDVEATVPAAGTLTKNSNFVSQTKTITGKISRDTNEGAALTDATVNAYKINGSGWVSANTDSNGIYSLQVTGGTWNLSYNSKTYPASWTAATVNDSVTFNNDNSTESITKNFVGYSVDATVKAKFVASDGSLPADGSVGLTFQGAGGVYSGFVDSSGNFTILVAQGTYTVFGWSSNNSYAVPKIDNITVAKAETKDLGTITLGAKNDTITGLVKDSAGKVIVGASVSAYRNDGANDWANSTTDSNGRYTLKVTPGLWQISAWPPYNSDAVGSGQPITITVASGVTFTHDFVLQTATNTITGTITDPDGNPITSFSPWVNASDASQLLTNIGVTANNGTFGLKVPKGTWKVTAYVYNQDYGSPEPVVVTFDGENQSKNITLKAVRNDSIIKGTVYDTNGSKITGKALQIWATNGSNSSWNQATVNESEGTYIIKVAKGHWTVGWWLDPALGYSSGIGQGGEVDIESGETKILDIKLRKSDATITGKVMKDDNSPFAGVWVTADTRDPNAKTAADYGYFSNGTASSSDGTFSLGVPAGTYYVGGNMWFGSGYINPKRQKITVESGKSVNVDLVFQKADATIVGRVTKDGNGVVAYITAYSEEGGYAETQSDTTGRYTFAATSGSRWHVRAARADGKETYRSKEVIVSIDSSKEPKIGTAPDLELTKQKFSLPSSQTVSFDPTVQQNITLEDGTILTIPANATAKAGTITISAIPDINLPSEATAKPIAYGYNFTAVDQNGREITKFNSNITIQMPYEEAWLTDNGVSTSDLNTAYYDQGAGTWLSLSQCTVSAKMKTVTCQVDHFSKFALVAAADTTPPAAPTEQKISAEPQFIRVSWQNPADSDFDSITIYRSTEKDKLGDQLTAGNREVSYDDKANLVKGARYYYTVKAVDKSANESINTEQLDAVSKLTTSSILPKTGRESDQNLGVIGWLIMIISSSLLALSPKVKRFRHG